MPEIDRIKCIIAGDPAVGKSAITQMLLSDGSKFPKSYNLTFGIELNAKYLEIEGTGHSCELLIFDSSGHDIYNDLLLKTWEGAKLMLVVYDVTSQQSLENVATWVQMAKQAIKTEIPIALFGNKIDLSTRRCISKEKGEEVSNRLNMVAHFEGSAKDFTGIRDVFEALVQNLMNK